MQRCLQLAVMGAGQVAPNPMVGAVLVYDDRIIGEGYHRHYGKPHAEVNCIADAEMQLAASGGITNPAETISRSVLFVSLEPCAHLGKTPACADLIIEKKIPDVVIGCRDSFEKVNGKGIERLRAAGVNVTLGVLEKECLELNKRFFTFHDLQRPYIILKWAQSGDGKIAPLMNYVRSLSENPEGGTLESAGNKRLMISNGLTDRLVHKWRSEEASILVGTNTALLDDPALTTRLWPGKDPVRLVLDKDLKLPMHLKIFDGSVKTIVFNFLKKEDKGLLHYFQLNKEKNIIPQILSALYEQQVQSVIVEGGAKLLQSFIDAGLWDEVRIISNEQMTIGNGLNAPLLKKGILLREEKMATDVISFYARTGNKE